MAEDASKKKPRKKKIEEKTEEKVEIPEPKIRKVNFDSRADTYHHIKLVQRYMQEFIKHLLDRALVHDQSKLEDPEKEHWDRYTHLLAESEYGGDEWQAMLDALKPALDAHYAKNTHHPQHYPDGLNDMTLMDIVEMFCDWKASSERQNDGNLRKSLEHNKGRFKMSPQLYKIFENTMKELGY